MSPSTKVTTAAVAGAVVTFLLWVAKSAGWVDDIPEEAVAAATTVVAFVLSYFMPETNPAPSSRGQS